MPRLARQPFGAELGRRVLLLQGPSSLFFRDLGRALRRRGAKAIRLGFAPGDRLYWTRDAGEFVRCPAGKAEFPDWFASFCARTEPTDLVMLGDGRFYHRVAAECVRSGQIAARLHVIEHGYLRPGLITVDPDGMGANSRIADRFAHAGAIEVRERPTRAMGGSFAEYALLDVGYHTVNMLAGPVYAPNYLRHSLDHPLREYIGWMRKAATRPVRRHRRLAAEKRIRAVSGRPRYLFPLQLATDFQIRDHGCGEPLQDTLVRILRSFAEHAPKRSLLVVKRHPLDNGWTPWHRLTGDLAALLAVRDRVEYVDGGSLEALLDGAAGVVTVNSTVGLTAVLSGVPCCVLGRAIYDLPGLTSQDGLDTFWSRPTPPDVGTARRFEAFLESEYHVPGTFEGPGSKVGAENLAELICEGRAE